MTNKTINISYDDYHQELKDAHLKGYEHAMWDTYLFVSRGYVCETDFLFDHKVKSLPILMAEVNSLKRKTGLIDLTEERVA